MSDDNATRILNKYEKLVKNELPELPHLHPHLFRHTRAMHLLEAGVPLALIGEWLGHTDLETTRIYATATISMKREASMKVTSAHPTIFPNNNQFMYLDDEEKMRKLYGLNDSSIQIIIPMFWALHCSLTNKRQCFIKISE